MVPGNPYERLRFLRPGGSDSGSGSGSGGGGGGGANEGRELPALNAASLLEAAGLDGNLSAASVMAPKGEPAAEG